MKDLRRNKDGGFSIVELIIVIAILSIVSGLTFSMTGILNGRRAYVSAEKTVQLLSRTKGQTLAWSKGGFLSTAEEVDVMLTLRREADGMNALVTVREEEEQVLLSTDRVRFTAVLAPEKNDGLAGATEVILTEDNTVRIAFDKKTGALLPDESGYYVKRILLTEDNKEYTVHLVPATGTCYLEGGTETAEEETPDA